MFSNPSQVYEDYVFISRYARFDYNRGHRELCWADAVERLRKFITVWAENKNFTKSADFRNTLEEALTAIENKEILPSMRFVAMAGDAVLRDNTCIYNCSYVPVDSISSFAEILFILMQGTGVGFSVAKNIIERLPPLPSGFIEDSYQTIVVEDTTEGWCDALDTFMNCLYSGRIVNIDVSKIRPAGTVLKTKGGRASGPEPFVSLINFITKIFINRVEEEKSKLVLVSWKGFRLNSQDIHDIICKIGDIVVVGGVRRSALISLGDLDDTSHRNLKSGNWWENHSIRSNANNSAIYINKPTEKEFIEEWESIYKSGSGERGIWNLEAVRNKLKEINRWNGNEFWLDSTKVETNDVGCNPCSEIILFPREFCNLTTIVANENDTPQTLANKVKLATFFGTLQACFTDFKYLDSLGRTEYDRNAQREALLGVSITGIHSCSHLIFDPKDFDNDSHRLASLLKALRKQAKDTNVKFSAIMGIACSAAITCIKPEGTTSALCGTSSGLHPDFSEFYIRRAISDKKDPLAEVLIKAGVPYEEGEYNKNSVVFSFPLRGKKTSPCAEPHNMMRLYSIYQKHWCDHKPSVTITYRNKDEFNMLGYMIWKDWDNCIGITVFPEDNTVYSQAPFEKITEEKYNQLVSSFPIVDFTKLKDIEHADSTVPTFECVGSTCAIKGL